MSVVICRSRGPLGKVITRCPTCQQTTEHVERFTAWYGRYQHCCRCGDSWGDGWLLERPFARGWRRRYAARHRQMWDEALSPLAYDAACKAAIAAEFTPKEVQA